MSKVVKPVTITQRVWDSMSKREKKFLIEHERMHEEFRRRAGYEHMSAEEIFRALMESNVAADDCVNALLLAEYGITKEQDDD